jgi:elongation factor P
MAQISTNEFKAGLKVIVEGQPYTIVLNEFVRPGKGQAFNRVKIKHVISGRVIEKNFKSGEKLDVADVEEMKLRLLYVDSEEAVFMNDVTFDQFSVKLDIVGDCKKWLKEEMEYSLIFYNGNIVGVEPPTFLELKIVETSAGDRGNTASGRVMKPAILETGAEIQVPIFIEQDEVIKVDTRTDEYVARAAK